MKQVAIEKAQARLVKAHEAIARASVASNYHAFDSAWSDFLTAINQVYTIIEKGAKSNAISRQWFGGKKKKECKDDPLLQYILQARNSDEHGLEPVTRQAGGNIRIMPTQPGGNVYIEHMIASSKGIHSYRGGPAIVEITAPHAVLVPVLDDRYGNVFNPPTSHMGTPLDDTSPVAVGKVGLQYFEKLIAEARTFV